MAAEPALTATERPRPLHPELDVVPLLKSYRDAMVLARRPPASLSLWRPLRWLHLRLRPRWGCGYFTARYVRGRVDALERALAGRNALGEADANDHAEADAIGRFKASLPPAPSRLFTVGALIAGIVLAQGLISGLFALVHDSSASRYTNAFGEIGVNPDAKQFADIGSALLSASYYEHGVIVTAVLLVLYAFGRPMASGYRLSYLCLGRADRFGRSRRRSELCTAAAGLRTVEREQAAVRVARADFRREAPLDLLVKTLPGLLVAYWLVGSPRFSPEGFDGDMLTGWAVVVVALGAATAWATRRLGPRHPRWRALAGLTGVGLLIWASVDVARSGSEQTRQTVWVAVASLVLLRFAWLLARARARGYSRWWIVMPVVAVVGLGIASKLNLTSDRASALEAAGLAELPSIDRADLQLAVATHRNLGGADLRGQDLHGMSLVGERLGEARLALADLRDADLRGADLSGADLRGAVAARADLEFANLQGANLYCSDLRGVRLGDAKLIDADLGGAIVDASTEWPTGFLPPRSVQRDDGGTFDRYGYIAACFGSTE